MLTQQNFATPDLHSRGIPLEHHGNASPAPAHSPQNVAADDLPTPTQVPIDLIDEASMESFPCSDPPSSGSCHI